MWNFLFLWLHHKFSSKNRYVPLPTIFIRGTKSSIKLLLERGTFCSFFLPKGGTFCSFFRRVSGTFCSFHATTRWNFLFLFDARGWNFLFLSIHYYSNSYISAAIQFMRISTSSIRNPYEQESAVLYTFGP